MFIQTETTPNPATLKFLPGLSVMDEGTADYQNADDAGNSPLAQRLFAVAGVRGVFLGRDFVTITKDEATDWDHAKPALLGAIMEHFQSGQPVIQGDQAADHGTQHSEEDAGIVSQIKNCWILVCAPLLPKMAVTSRSTDLNVVLCIFR